MDDDDGDGDCDDDDEEEDDDDDDERLSNKATEMFFPMRGSASKEGEAPGKEKAPIKERSNMIEPRFVVGSMWITVPHKPKGMGPEPR